MIVREPPGKWTLSLVLAAATWLVGTPANAQFEEPDTVPRWAIGPLFEATFRGGRGDRVTTSEAVDPTVEFSDGPAFGVRVERRLARTVAVGVLASYASSSEKFDPGAVTTVTRGDLTLINLAGELLWKVKPQVPGYFLFGGGIRFVSPESGVEPLGRSGDYIEPMAVVGLGLEAFSRRIGVLRAFGRLYVTATADQGSGFSETNSLSTDFALGLSYLFRF